MTLYDLADGYRGKLIARERGTAAELARDYGKAYRRIQERLKVLTRKIEQASPEARQSWLYEQSRLRAFQEQVKAEIDAWAKVAGRRIEAEQLAFAELANNQTLGILTSQANVGISFRRIDSRAFLKSHGFLTDGSPLRNLLDSFGLEAGQAAADALSQSVLLGVGPAQTARLLQQALAVNLSRALTIARTETLRAFREAQREVFLQNSDIITGWVWRSARNLRTCASCWAMDGTVHPISDRLTDHPNGRCYAVAILRADLASDRPDMGLGRDVFARLSQDSQVKILVQAKYAAYQTGAVTLDSNPTTGISGLKLNAICGPMRYERSLLEMGLDSSYYLQMAESLLQ